VSVTGGGGVGRGVLRCASAVCRRGPCLRANAREIQPKLGLRMETGVYVQICVWGCGGVGVCMCVRFGVYIDKYIYVYT